MRQPDGVRLLDDRSLNGVFVNGARVDGKTLQDGDEIIVGRYRLAFVSVRRRTRPMRCGRRAHATAERPRRTASARAA